METRSQQNGLIMKEYKVTYNNDNPSEYPHGRLTLEGNNQQELCIMNWHSFDDMGASLETVQVWSPSTKRLFEIYSQDEGETFSFTQPEHYLA